MYVVRADYPSVNILACIPLFDGKPFFMLTMLILGSLLSFFTCLGLGILVVLILDNAKFHKSSYVLATASRLNITLLFLPPYSP